MNVCTWWKRTCERQRGVRVFDLTAEVLRHVAVGTRVTSRPRTNPYMRLSLIRLLPRVRTHHQIHDDTHAAIACDMLNPAQCPEHALRARIPLGLGPSPHPTPQQIALPCSPASQLLWPRPTSHARASSATAPRLPDADRRTRERTLNRRPDVGYPRFRRDPFARDVLL